MRGVATMNSSKYAGKCLGIPKNNQFTKINDDPMKRIESKVQKCVRKLKCQIMNDKYSKLYPTGSNSVKFYGTAKSISFSIMTPLINLP